MASVLEVAPHPQEDARPLFLDFDDDQQAYAFDFIDAHGAEPHGCLLTLRFTAETLDTCVAIADAASWAVPSLGVKQEGYAHSGFRGRVDGLLSKTRHDISMMRKVSVSCVFARP